MTQAVLKPELSKEQVSTGIDADSRRQIAEALSSVLTDTYYLVIKTHIYHWNVVGPLFHAVHEMTEEQYKNLFDAADDIAERIRALGHRAPISDAAGPDESVVSTAASARSAHDMIADLIGDHEAAIRNMRQAAEMAEDKHDLVTHDMLTARLTYHEQVVWMLRALITE